MARVLACASWDAEAGEPCSWHGELLHFSWPCNRLPTQRGQGHGAEMGWIQEWWHSQAIRAGEEPAAGNHIRIISSLRERNAQLAEHPTTKHFSAIDFRSHSIKIGWYSSTLPLWTLAAHPHGKQPEWNQKWLSLSTRGRSTQLCEEQ